MIPSNAHDIDQSVLVDAYEALRGGSSVRGSMGRALLIDRGIAAWVEAWHAPVLPSAPLGARRPRQPFDSAPLGPFDEATRILVSMALNHFHREALHS